MDFTSDQVGGIALVTVALGFVALYVFLLVYPMWRIFRRMGYSVGGRILWLIAFGLLPYIAIWFLAFMKWPALRDEAGSAI